jgi:hypothetical protein
MPLRSPPNPTGRNAWWRAVLVFVIFCTLMDLFPRHSAPDFRYTGSDPAFHVWNLGWPVALAVLDSRSGLQLGPFLYIVVPFQAVVALLIGVGLALRKWHNQTLQATAAPPYS